MPSACTFQTLDEAVAAFSLGPVRFRCSFCGGVHASDSRSWRSCLKAFAYWKGAAVGRDEDLPEIPASAPENNPYWAFFSEALDSYYLYRHQVPFRAASFCERHAPALLAVPGVERFLAEKFAEEKRGHVAKALPLMEDLIGARRDALRVVEANAVVRFEPEGGQAVLLDLPKKAVNALKGKGEAVFAPVRAWRFSGWVYKLAKAVGLPDGDERYELTALLWDKGAGTITAVLAVRLRGSVMGRCVVRCSRGGPAAVVSILPPRRRGAGVA